MLTEPPRQRPSRFRHTLVLGITPGVVEIMGIFQLQGV